MEGEDWQVGFDEIFDDMCEGSLIEFEGFNNYPAARIVAHNDHHFTLELNLDGFANQIPRVKTEDGLLVITASKNDHALNGNKNYLQRGISARGFRRSYQLGKGDRVLGTNLQQGILQVEIERMDSAAVTSESSWVRAG
ncbi:MAG: molecular chaperone IbpA [Actinomycetota bacterium]|jgi:molecular chaperone IbpA